MNPPTCNMTSVERTLQIVRWKRDECHSRYGYMSDGQILTLARQLFPQRNDKVSVARVKKCLRRLQGGAR